MSLFKAIVYRKEYRKLNTTKVINNKLFNCFKRQLPSQLQLCEWLGLHCYGKKVKRYKA